MPPFTVDNIDPDNRISFLYHLNRAKKWSVLVAGENCGQMTLTTTRESIKAFYDSMEESQQLSYEFRPVTRQFIVEAIKG
ncbi:MAG TPA: hypothetical protein VHW43_08255 [Puia sp.]|nr:hypothetical protein [Puia sp.]